jgi:hypothetical protein
MGLSSAATGGSRVFVGLPCCMEVDLMMTTRLWLADSVPGAAEEEWRPKPVCGPAGVGPA